jgi:hypothetical protein
MSDGVFDFAVFGATPLAQLLAGLLASTHGRRVLLVGESQAGYRLVRGIDLSSGPVTRPESWAMLTRAAPETTRLVARIGGRGALNRVDPIFFAQGREHTEALSHMRHMAAGFGLAAEPVSPSLVGAGRAGVVLRDVVKFNRPLLEAGIDRWLARSNVVHIGAQKVDIAADGAVQVLAAGTSYSARQAVLCDDEAIMAWLPLRQWPQLLRRITSSSILTTPTRPLAAAIMLDLDSGTYLTQQAEGGISAFGRGDLAEMASHLHALLGRKRQVEQAGQTSFQALATLDGAPAFGRISGVGADVVAGLGCYGAFIAPALARWLAGDASPVEAEWFGARLVNRAGKTVPVDEYAMGDAGPTA